MGEWLVTMPESATNDMGLPQLLVLLTAAQPDHSLHIGELLLRFGGRSPRSVP